MKRLILAVTILGCCAACETPIPQDPIARAEYFEQLEKENIAEACLRYMFQHNYTLLQHNAKGYYILLSGDNPSETFLKRFRDLEIPVKTRSRSNDEFMTSFVRDRNDPEKLGIIFTLNVIIRANQTEAVVHTTHYENPMSQSDITYTLTLKNNTWQVTNEKINRLM